MVADQSVEAGCTGEADWSDAARVERSRAIAAHALVSVAKATTAARNLAIFTPVPPP
jgi:hypothetical protein